MPLQLTTDLQYLQRFQRSPDPAPGIILTSAAGDIGRQSVQYEDLQAFEVADVLQTLWRHS